MSKNNEFQKSQSQSPAKIRYSQKGQQQTAHPNRFSKRFKRTSSSNNSRGSSNNSEGGGSISKFYVKNVASNVREFIQKHDAKEQINNTVLAKASSLGANALGKKYLSSTIQQTSNTAKNQPRHQQQQTYFKTIKYQDNPRNSYFKSYCTGAGVGETAFFSTLEATENKGIYDNTQKAINSNTSIRNTSINYKNQQKKKELQSAKGTATQIQVDSTSATTGYTCTSISTSPQLKSTDTKTNNSGYVARKSTNMTIMTNQNASPNKRGNNNISMNTDALGFNFSNRQVAIERDNIKETTTKQQTNLSILSQSMGGCNDNSSKFLRKNFSPKRAGMFSKKVTSSSCNNSPESNSNHHLGGHESVSSRPNPCVQSTSVSPRSNSTTRKRFSTSPNICHETIDQLIQSLKNKNSNLQLQIQKTENNQKRLQLLNDQLTSKGNRMQEKIDRLETDNSHYCVNNKTLREQNQKLRSLVKQREILMTKLMKTTQTSGKQCKISGRSHEDEIKRDRELLVSKILQFQFQNQKLKDQICKLKKQVQQRCFNETQSITTSRADKKQNQSQSQSSGAREFRSLATSREIRKNSISRKNSLFSLNQTQHLLNQPQSQHTQQTSVTAENLSQLHWAQNTMLQNCIEQRDKEILELREQIKNLQIQINYINRKWSGELERARDIEKLEYSKLRQKYKSLLMKYKHQVKNNFIMQQQSASLSPTKLFKKPVITEGMASANDRIPVLQSQQPQHQQNISYSCSNCSHCSSIHKKRTDFSLSLNIPDISPSRRKSADHIMKDSINSPSRGVMQELKSNLYDQAGQNRYRKGQGQKTDDIEFELLEYSSCDQQKATP